MKSTTKRFMKRLMRALFRDERDYRILIFNQLILEEIAVCILMTLFPLMGRGNPVNAVMNAVAGIFCLGVAYYAKKSGRYEICSMVIVIFIFLLMVPAIFFFGRGYYSGMPCFFVFSVVFTVLLLEGKKVALFVGVEVIVYTGCYLTAYFRPEIISHPPSEYDFFMDALIGFLVVASIVGMSVQRLLRLYHIQGVELEQARLDADAASRAKSAFLANISHEIRTPLNAILGMNTMIYRSCTTEEVKEYSRDISSSGRWLLEIISNILDLSKIEAGKFQVEERPYDLVPLLSDLIFSGQMQAGNRSLEFDYAVEESLPASLYGSARHIRQIVGNFLSNAVKYTEKGGVTLTVGRISAGDAVGGDSVMLRIAVSDTGIGILEEDKKRLFEAFERGRQPGGRYTEGSGLGLVIAKELAGQMGGRILVDSEPGKGSTFCLELPQRICEPHPIGPVSGWLKREEEGEGGSFLAPEGRVLLVDDDESNRRLECALLEPTMLQIDRAKSGPEAICMAEKKHYHVILMDYMMPGMDGLETMREMERRNLTGNTAVIALTADAVAETRERLLREGFCAYLSKPVSGSRLEAAILSCLPQELVTRTDSISPCTMDEDAVKQIRQQLLGYDIDLEKGLAFSGGDIRHLGMRAYYFRDGFDRGVRRAKELISSGNLKGLSYIAHSMKSNAQGLGAGELYHISARMEQRWEDREYIESSMALFFLEWNRAYEGTGRLLETLREMFPYQEKSEQEKLTAIQYGRRALEAVRMCSWIQAKSEIAALLETEQDEKLRKQLQVISSLVEDIEFEEAEPLLEDYLKQIHGKGA